MHNSTLYSYMYIFALYEVLVHLLCCVVYRGDVVIVRSPEDPKCLLCKRVAAMVGELSDYTLHVV